MNHYQTYRLISFNDFANISLMNDIMPKQLSSTPGSWDNLTKQSQNHLFMTFLIKCKSKKSC